MTFQKEAPIYLQVRRSSLENIGILITNPFDYIQVVPFVNGFINTVQDQYFKPTATKVIYSTTIPTNYSNPQYVKAYYEVDELIVAGASPYAPVLYSSTLGLLAGSQQFIGLEQNLGCYDTGNTPINPGSFKMIFKPFNAQDPATGQYLVYNLISHNTNTIVATIPNVPGYDAVNFVSDTSIDAVDNPPATATGYYIFRMYPEIEIQLNS